MALEVSMTFIDTEEKVIPDLGIRLPISSEFDLTERQILNGISEVLAEYANNN